MVFYRTSVHVRALLLLYYLLCIEDAIGAEQCVYLVNGVDINNGSTDGQGQLSCCTTESCIFSSLEEALGNVTIDNVVINITIDVVLSSVLAIENNDDITIVGLNNPTVFCTNTGGVHFVSGTNVTINGITWNGCGFNDTNNSIIIPGIAFYNSSNVAVLDCSFYNSTGQAVFLSNMSGDVHINGCLFTRNNECSGHGTAMHYSSGDTLQPLFIVNNCNFTLNGPAESVIYIEGLNRQPLSLQNSVFNSNQGVPIYVSDTSLLVSGTVLFQQNMAENGGGIFSVDSFIAFDSNSMVRFTENIANLDGGAVYLSNSTISFGANLSAEFENNRANELGGSIFSNTQILITISDSLVMFRDNTANKGVPSTEQAELKYIFLEIHQ